MDIYDHIKGNPETIRELIKRGEDAYMAQRFAANDVLLADLGNRGSETPFRLWLRDKHVKNCYENPDVTPALWDEWQVVKASYIAELAAKAAASHAEYEAKQKAEDAARRAELHETQKRIAAVEARQASMVAKLQTYVFPTITLEPVDYKKLHDLKKTPTKSKRHLARRWRDRFEGLPPAVQYAWEAFHESSRSPIDVEYEFADVEDDADDEDGQDKTHSDESAALIFLTPCPPGQRNIFNGNVDLVVAGLRDAEFKRFREFSEGVRRLLALIGNPIDDVIVPPHDPHRPQPAQELDDIEAPTKAAYVVPGLIPRGGLTVAHGDPGAGKSLLAQKVAVVVADKNGATFEGIEVEHGQVIYATLDPSAAPSEIKPGVIEIRDRLGLAPSGRLHITAAPLILNEPISVEHWLELNAARLPAKLIIVDSLFSAVAGSLAQDTVVQGAMDGVKMLLKHVDAVVIVHHDNKGGEIFGSQFLTAMMAAKVGIVRNTLKDGRPSNRVAVTVERLKFDPPTLKLAYTLDGPLLSLDESARAADVEDASIRRPDILAALPTVATPIREARKLIEHMLSSGTPKARAEYSRRLRKDWEAAGLIVVDGDTVRRVA